MGWGRDEPRCAEQACKAGGLEQGVEQNPGPQDWAAEEGGFMREEAWDGQGPAACPSTGVSG